MSAEALAEVGAKEGTLRRVPRAVAGAMARRRPKSSGGHGCPAFVAEATSAEWAKAVGLHSLFRIGREPFKWVNEHMSI